MKIVLDPTTQRQPMIVGLLAAATALLISCVVPAKPWDIPANLQIIAEYDFSSPSHVNDWIAEGPAEVRIEDGALWLESVYREAVTQRLTSEEIWAGNGTNERMFRNVLVSLVRSAEPEVLSDYEIGTPIRYGHTVLWNRTELPDNYVVQYRFKNRSPYPLHLVHFSAKGLNGESIFAEHLSPRNGIASQYMHGDIRTYRLSYFSGTRGTINMRKAPGRHLIDEMEDTSVGRDGHWQEVRLVKYGEKIRFFLDGELAFHFDDAEPFDGGYWGFRLMLMASAAYDDIKVFAILE